MSLHVFAEYVDSLFTVILTLIGTGKESKVTTGQVFI